MRQCLVIRQVHVVSDGEDFEDLDLDKCNCAT